MLAGILVGAWVRILCTSQCNPESWNTRVPSSVTGSAIRPLRALNLPLYLGPSMELRGLSARPGRLLEMEGRDAPCSPLLAVLAFPSPFHLPLTHQPEGCTDGLKLERRKY